MNNHERRAAIQELKDKLMPLNYAKMVASLRYNFLENPYKRGLTVEQQTEADELKRKLIELNNEISPLYGALRQLQVRYGVEYEGEVFEGGIKKMNPHKKVFYFSTDYEIDTYETLPDYNDPEVWELINEIRDYIFLQEYSQFTIQHIKKL